MMRCIALPFLLVLAAVPVSAQIVRPTQPQQNVPFPVINPAQGLNNILTYPLRRDGKPQINSQPNGVQAPPSGYGNGIPVLPATPPTTP